MTTTKTKERTGRPIEVLPRGSISKKQLLSKSASEYETEQLPNGEFRYKLVSKGLLSPEQKERFTNLKPSKKRRAVKGTSDYIDYDVATRIGNQILWHDRQPQVGFYVLLSINIGRRVGDVLKFRHSDFIGRKVGDVLTITEQKTGKKVDITLNDKVISAYAYLQKRSRCKPNDFIFLSQKNHVFHVTTINRTLKRIFAGFAPVISSHSLRKSFGRHVYNQLGKNEDALIYLSELFGHSSLKITRKYLGIRKQELANIYLSL